MTDITSTHLEAAFIDQSVAGAFPDKRYAFVAVTGDGGWQLGVAVADQPGYNPIAGKTFATESEAKQWADGLNTHVGRDAEAVMRIVSSTMRGQSRRRTRLL